MSLLRIPSATYRLQFNQQFKFQQALKLVNYFYELGISDCYASPIVKSQPGSMHGYDVIDQCQINPEIGTIEEFVQLSCSLQQKDMGLLVDIVPNHMCVAEYNRWWNDVLENGPSSLHANYFCIIWNPPKSELKNKVLLPVLGKQYGKVIENQELKVMYDSGSFVVEYIGRKFPLDPYSWPLILEPVAKQIESQSREEKIELLEFQSVITALQHLPLTIETDSEKCKERNREKEIIKKRLVALLEKHPDINHAIQAELIVINGEKGNPNSFDRLENLLNAQAYRLSFWRVTNDEINYRRFFDINDLAGMRVEELDVFNAIHELMLRLVQEGHITGFRIDHIDGLFDPQQYLYRLQEACFEALRGEKRRNVSRQFYTVVEKIIVGQEELSPRWLTFGTTGYDYLNELNGLFIIKESESKFKQLYSQFIKRHDDFIDIIHACKKLILIVSLSSDLYILACHLEEICEQHRWSRDYTLEGLRFALRDVIACFPVYRTYIRLEDQQVSSDDKKHIMTAIKEAKVLNPAIDLSIFDFIESVLLLEDPQGLTDEQVAHRRQFVMRFQQLTGPVMAKGFEDTAFYRYYPLVSLNEVGMNPYTFGTSVQSFHHRNLEFFEKWPHSLSATFTHDTKRSEDVRARINVISENPGAWEEAIYRWRDYNKDKKTLINQREAPNANEEYLLYQTLIGTWPLYPMDAASRVQYIERIDKYMNKAIKEAKIHTSWINVNEPYEKAVSNFIHQILEADVSNANFLKDFTQYVQSLIRPGLFNSLSQTLLKMTTPGIPDFYQGSELWEFTLVDPDNRHPIDYSYRFQLLRRLKEKFDADKEALMRSLIETPEDGLIKLYLISQVLHFRRKYSILFQEGNYQPLRIEGEKCHHAIAFCRKKETQCVIVAVGRFYTPLLGSHFQAPIGNIWKNTLLSTEGILPGLYKDVLSGVEIQVEEDQSISFDRIFSQLPYALLHRKDEGVQNLDR